MKPKKERAPIAGGIMPWDEDLVLVFVPVGEFGFGGGVVSAPPFLGVGEAQRVHLPRLYVLVLGAFLHLVGGPNAACREDRLVADLANVFECFSAHRFLQ